MVTREVEALANHGSTHSSLCGVKSSVLKSRYTTSQAVLSIASQIIEKDIWF